MGNYSLNRDNGGRWFTHQSDMEASTCWRERNLKDATNGSIWDQNSNLIMEGGDEEMEIDVTMQQDDDSIHT